MEALKKLTFSDIKQLKLHIEEGEADYSYLTSNGVKAEDIERLTRALASESPNVEYLKDKNIASLNPDIVISLKKQILRIKRQDIETFFLKLKTLLEAEAAKLKQRFVFESTNKKIKHLQHPSLANYELHGKFEISDNRIIANNHLYLVEKFPNSTKIIYYGKVNEKGLPDTGDDEKEIGVRIFLSSRGDIVEVANFKNGQANSKNSLMLRSEADGKKRIVVSEIKEDSLVGQTKLIDQDLITIKRASDKDDDTGYAAYGITKVDLFSSHKDGFMHVFRLIKAGGLFKGGINKTKNGNTLEGTFFEPPDKIFYGKMEGLANGSLLKEGALSADGNLRIKGKWIEKVLVGPFKIECPTDHFIESIEGTMRGGKLDGDLVINYRDSIMLKATVSQGQANPKMEVKFPDQSKYLGELLFPNNDKDTENKNLTRSISEEDLYYFLKDPKAHMVFFANPFKFDGQGTLLDADNDISFDGLWKSGEPVEGTAANHPMNGVLYSGPVINREFNGFGRITNEQEGYEYEGDLVNSEFNGQGTLIQEKKIIEGKFHKGRPVEGAVDIKRKKESDKI